MPRRNGKKSKSTRRQRQPEGAFTAAAPGATLASRLTGFDSPGKARVGTIAPLHVRKVIQFDDLQVGTAAGAGAGFALTFIPDQLPGWNSYAALFNQFKFDKVTVSIEPTITDYPVLMLGAGSVNPCYAQSVHSSFDALNLGAPSSGTTLMNDSAYHRTRFTQPHVRTFVPLNQMDVNDSLIDTDTTLINSWMSTANAYDSVYYGMRVYLDYVSTAGLPFPVRFNVYCTYEMSFRDPKI